MRQNIDRISEALRASNDSVPALILNAALIIAIVAFQWSLLEIAVMYVLEIAVINLLYLGVSLFTPEPVEDLGGERWNTEPAPIRPVSWLPPVYYRNARFGVRYVLFSGILIPILLQRLVARYGVESVLTPSVGLAICGITLFELRRIWRYFIRDQRYAEKSPLDAIQFGIVPLTELLLISIYVIAPVTVILVTVGIAFGIDYTSRAILLLYLVPIGAIRVWISGLDPQTDDIEIGIS